MQEPWVQFPGREDPLESEMANYSSIVAWEIPWTEGSGRLKPWGCKELNINELLSKHE